MNKNFISYLSLSVLITGSILFIAPIVNSTEKSNPIHATTALKTTATSDNTMKSEITYHNVNNKGTFDNFNHMPAMLPFENNNQIFSVVNNTTGGLIVYDQQGSIINSFGGSKFIANTGFSFSLIEDVAPSSRGNFLYLSTLFNSTSNHDSYGAIFKWDWQNNIISLVVNLKSGTNITDSYNIEVIPGKTENDDLILGLYADYYFKTIYMSPTVNYFLIDTVSKTFTNGNFNPHSYGSTRSFYFTPLEMKVFQDGNGYQLTIFSRSEDGRDSNRSELYTIPFTIDSNHKLVLSKGYVSNPSPFIYWNYAYYQNTLFNVNITNNTVSQKITPDSKISLNLLNSYCYTNTSTPSTDLWGQFTLDYPKLDQNKKHDYGEKTSQHIIQQDTVYDGSFSYELHTNSAALTLNGSTVSIKLTNDLDTDYQFVNNQQAIQGFSYSDALKTKLLLYDSNGMVSQYDFKNETFKLVHGIANIKNNSQTLKVLASKKTAGDVDANDIETLFDIKGLSIEPSKTSFVADDNKGTLTVTVYATDKQGKEYTSSETLRGFQTYYTAPAWSLGWTNDNVIDKKRGPSDISDAEIDSWAIAGDDIATHIANETIVRDDGQGTIDVTVVFDNSFPKTFDTKDLKLSKSYGGFLTFSSDPKWKISWKDNNEIDKNRGVAENSISNSEVRSWVKIGSNLPKITDQDIIIGRDTTNNTIKISINIDKSKLPLNYPTNNLKLEMTYGGFGLSYSNKNNLYIYIGVGIGVVLLLIILIIIAISIKRKCSKNEKQYFRKQYKKLNKSLGNSNQPEANNSLLHQPREFSHRPIPSGTVLSPSNRSGGLYSSASLLEKQDPSTNEPNKDLLLLSQSSENDQSTSQTNEPDLLKSQPDETATLQSQPKEIVSTKRQSRKMSLVSKTTNEAESIAIQPDEIDSLDLEPKEVTLALSQPIGVVLSQHQSRKVRSSSRRSSENQSYEIDLTKPQSRREVSSSELSSENILAHQQNETDSLSRRSTEKNSPSNRSRRLAETKSFSKQSSKKKPAISQLDEIDSTPSQTTKKDSLSRRSTKKNSLANRSRQPIKTSAPTKQSSKIESSISQPDEINSTPSQTTKKDSPSRRSSKMSSPANRSRQSIETNSLSRRFSEIDSLPSQSNEINQAPPQLNEITSLQSRSNAIDSTQRRLRKILWLSKQSSEVDSLSSQSDETNEAPLRPRETDLPPQLSEIDSLQNRSNEIGSTQRRLREILSSSKQSIETDLTPNLANEVDSSQLRSRVMAPLPKQSNETDSLMNQSYEINQAPRRPRRTYTPPQPQEINSSQNQLSEVDSSRPLSRKKRSAAKHPSETNVSSDQPSETNQTRRRPRRTYIPPK